MLRLLLGRAGTGKTARVQQEISRRMAEGRGGCLLIVPEQYSHEAERELAARCGDSVSRYAEVFSFSGLARRVLAQYGGSSQPWLDKGGRLLCMAQAVAGVGPQLRLYAAARRRHELPGQLLHAVDELKTAGVSSEQLARAAGCGGLLGEKLSDLALILEAYDAVVAAGHADPMDRLGLLAEKLPETDLGAKNAVYLDGFIDFTGQERALLRALLRQGVELTVCLTLDALTSDNEIFSLSRRAAQLLLSDAAALGQETRLERLDETGGRDEALRFYSEHVFSSAAGGYGKPTQALRLLRCESMAAECELAAERCLSLVRDGGFRWRDLAIAVRGFEDYRPLLESVFRHYGVPLFIARKSELMEKPLPALLSSAFEILEGGWAVDDLTDYLRTGLSGLSVDEADLLIDYIFLWQLGAAAWERRGDWKQHPDGYGGKESERSLRQLEELNALRRRVAQPLLHLAERGKAAVTAAEQAAALALYFEELELPRLLSERAAQLSADGRETLARETAQLWELAVSALEQCEAILGENEMDQSSFGRLYCQMLSQYDVGVIPVALDRVWAGDFDRMRRRSIRHLLVLGASESRLPKNDEQGGLFTEEERRRLLELDIDLGGAGDSELWREFALMYHVFSLPKDSLSLSCPQVDGEGEEQRPAFAFQRAAALFQLPVEMPSLRLARLSAPGPALSLAAQAIRGGSAEEQAAAAYVSEHRPETWARLQAAAALTRGRLSPRSVEALYGRELRLSASRIDRFAGCQFSYFCQYGMKAKPYEPASFKPPEIGTFMHAILERVGKVARERGGFKKLGDEELRTLTEGYIEDYIHSELNDFAEKTERFTHLFRRLSLEVQQVVADMAEELRHSDFEPLDFELDFSKAEELPPMELGEGEGRMALTGIVDRVDGWVKDDTLYLRVVDYKTGSKKFSLSDIWYGMGLQMLLYLFTLEEGGERRYGRRLVSAGVAYIPAKSRVLSVERPDEALVRDKRAEETRRTGLVLDDEALLTAWEHGEDHRYIPVKFTKGNKPSAGVASAAQFGQLARHIKGKLSDMARQLRAGSVAADPYYRSQKENACLHCDYFEACHFSDGENGESCRFFPRLRDGAVMEKLEEESHG